MVFYHDLVNGNEYGTYYLDMPSGLVLAKLTYDEWLNVQDIYSSWKGVEQPEHDIFELIMKTSAKERDPKYFNAQANGALRCVGPGRVEAVDLQRRGGTCSPGQGNCYPC